MADELADAIAAAAIAPASVTEDGATVQAHPLPDQIAADRYLRDKAAAGRSGFPLRIFKISPPAAV